MSKSSHFPKPKDIYGRTLHINDWVCFNYPEKNSCWRKNLICAKIRSIEFYEGQDFMLSFFESTHDDLVYADSFLKPMEHCVKITGKAIDFLNACWKEANKEYREMQGEEEEKSLREGVV